MVLSGEFGPFVCDDPIGKGGMSEVFRGEHRASGDHVALKITRFEHRDKLKRRSFAAEIAAMAGVYHPGIVRIHDWGALEDGSGNWCAMDYAPLGALTWSHIGSWSELRSLLLQVLSALGHAHARGIVHRDLKPQNVLMFDGPGGREYRLADFGLAHSRFVRDESQKTGMVSGTPAYMAPEQLHGLWREFGPWTDLYALGCMAHELVAGTLPFTGDSPVAVATAHVLRDPLPLVPRFPIPEEFAGWVRALLNRDWIHRPQDAVAARFALELMGEPVQTSVTPVVPGMAPPWATTALLGTLAAETLVDLGVTPATTLAAGEGEAPGGLAEVPFPESWETKGSSTARFKDAGSRLFALRETELVGQVAQRDVIWERCRVAAEERHTQVVILDGDDARAQRSLATWLVQRVREFTTLATISLDLSIAPFGRDPFREALESLLVMHGLEGARLREHLERSLRSKGIASEAMVDALVRAFAQERGQSVDGLEFRAAFYDLVVAMEEAGPLVLSVTGIEHDPGSWNLLEMLQQVVDGGILVVVVPRRGEWPVSVFEASVREWPGTALVAPERLDEERAGYLVDTYLRLVPELRFRWVNVAVQDVALAMDLIRYGTADGALVSSVDGYVLREGMSSLPETLEELLRLRVKALEIRSPTAARLVTAAASVDLSVTYEELADVAERIGIALRQSDIELLMRHELVHHTDGRYAFSDVETRAALLGLARSEDLEALERTWRGEGFRATLHRAELLVARGDSAGASQALVAAARLSLGRVASLWRWLPLARRIAESSDSDLLRAWTYVVEARALSDEQTSVSSAWVDEALAQPVVQRVPEVLTSLRLERINALSYEQRYLEGAAQSRRLLDEVESGTELHGEVLSILGWFLFAPGVACEEESEHVLLESIALLEELEAHAGAALALMSLALLTAKKGEADRTVQILNRAADLAVKADVDFMLPRVLLDGALAKLGVGRIDEALIDAQTAWRLGNWALPGYRGPLAINLSLALAHVGETQRAEAILAEAELHPVTQRGTSPWQIEAVQCVVAAVAGDTARWATLVEAGRVFRGVGHYRELSVAAWKRHGDPTRAKEAAEYLVSAQ